MDKKKLGAAMAAVFAYIKTGEEAYAMHLAQAAGAEAGAALPAVVQMPAPPANVWGLSGRQSQMQANTMMQLRVFK